MARIVEIEGMDEFRRMLKQEGPEMAMLGMAAGIYEVGTEVFAESQAQTPVKTGTLRSSGELHRPVVTLTKAEVTISYGGAASEYAWIVHEAIENYHAPPTKAKYLEDPVIEASRGFAARMVKPVARALERLRT